MTGGEHLISLKDNLSTVDFIKSFIHIYIKCLSRTNVLNLICIEHYGIIIYVVLDLKYIIYYSILF